MKVHAIQSICHSKNSISKKNNQALTTKNQFANPSFKGGKGAGVGSALGTAAVAWLGIGALIAAGPLAVIGGLLAGCGGGAAIGHGIEEAIDKASKDDKH